MENIVVKKKTSICGGSAIKILFLIAFICNIIYAILRCLHFNTNHELVFYKSFGFAFVISLLLQVIPFILFFLYIFIFYNKLKGTIVVPIMFLLSIIDRALLLVSNIPNLKQYFDYSVPEALLIILVDYLLPFVGYSLLLLSSLKGFYKEKLNIIGSSILIIWQVYYIFMFAYIFYEGGNEIFYLICNNMLSISLILLYVSILLFSIKNKIPTIIPLTHRERLAISRKKPEQILRMLQRKFELNMITEEEYQMQKAEIINRL